MAFKMKGFPLQAGTAPAKKYASDAQRKAIYASKAEEAEKKKRSAATQKSADQKTIEELIEEGFTPADARRMQQEGAITGRDEENLEKAKKNKKDKKKKPPTKQKTDSTVVDERGGTYDFETGKYTKAPKKGVRAEEPKNTKNLGKDLGPKRSVPIKQRIAPVQSIEPMPIPKNEPITYPTIRLRYRPVPDKIAKVPHQPTPQPPQVDRIGMAIVSNDTKGKKKGKRGPGRRSKVGKKITQVANIFRKKGKKKSPDFK